MVTGDEKWVTYDNIVRKRSRSKRGEAAQTMVKPGLTSRKITALIRLSIESSYYIYVQFLRSCKLDGRGECCRMCLSTISNTFSKELRSPGYALAREGVGGQAGAL
ncbi:hypothetical protein TNCV_2613701 [Trichonephila clavipes]|nr:hypothetical protein TNCV_2613701 [Trichonephila clavipes]